MHREAFEFVKEAFSKLITGPVSILEIGSRDINSTDLGMVLRDIKTPEGSKYVGIDIEEGRGVDIVCSSHDLAIVKFKANEFDIVLCCEMLEHDSAPHITAKQIRRVLKPEGYLILTTTGLDRFYHNPPHYWNFSLDGIRHLFRDYFIMKLEYAREGKDIHLIAYKEKS
jgi:SAM-dependent methyltransferase